MKRAQGRSQSSGVTRPRPSGERETSIRRGVEVLLSVAEDESLANGGLGVTRIADLLGREKSQVSRTLKALSEYGLVERNQDSTYRLGWGLFALAQVAGERRLLDAAVPGMRGIALSLGESVHLSVLQGTGTLTVLSESSGRTVQAVSWVGRITPAYCTSSGRALLLDSTEEDLERIFANVEFVALATRTVSSVHELALRIAKARRHGYVVVDEEFEPDLIGVAVPIRDANGTIVASLNVSAPRFRFLRRVAPAARELLAVSAELSHQLGARDAAQASA